MTENTLQYAFENYKICNYMFDHLFSTYSIFPVYINKKKIYKFFANFLVG